MKKKQMMDYRAETQILSAWSYGGMYKKYLQFRELLYEIQLEGGLHLAVSKVLLFFCYIQVNHKQIKIVVLIRGRFDAKAIFSKCMSKLLDNLPLPYNSCHANQI